jgi:hypothetical protein
MDAEKKNRFTGCSFRDESRFADAEVALHSELRVLHVVDGLYEGRRTPPDPASTGRTIDRAVIAGDRRNGREPNVGPARYSDALGSSLE